MYKSSKVHPEIMAPIPPASPKREEAPLEPLVSLLGKRTYDASFNENTVDDERYGQNINSVFFMENIGHGVGVPYDLEEGEIYEAKKNNTPTSQEEESVIVPSTVEVDGKQYSVDEILEWSSKYLASKKD